MKLRTSLFALVAVVMTSAVQAQSNQIAFSSNRSGTYMDIWSMLETGTNQTELYTGTTADLERPSVTRDGQRIVLDDHKHLYMINATGSGFQTLTTNETICTDTDSGCEDADAGPRDTSQFPPTGPDFHIVFTREFEDAAGERVADLYMATVDVSAGELVNVIQLTNDDDPDDNDLIDYQATWCGDSHIVWSREVFNQCENQPICAADEEYFWELCILEVDLGVGPVGEPDCYFSEDQDGTANHYPSCNDDGDIVAFAQSGGDLKDPQNPNVYIEAPHDVCTINLNPTPPDEPEDTLVCVEITPDVDDTKPVWSPSDVQIAYASERAWLGSTDYDIWVVNADFTQQPTPVNRTAVEDTENDPDTDPDWGPALLQE